MIDQREISRVIIIENNWFSKVTLFLFVSNVYNCDYIEKLFVHVTSLFQVYI